jgi:hypothetical protein
VREVISLFNIILSFRRQCLLGKVFLEWLSLYNLGGLVRKPTTLWLLSQNFPQFLLPGCFSFFLRVAVATNKRFLHTKYEFDFLNLSTFANGTQPSKRGRLCILYDVYIFGNRKGHTRVDRYLIWRTTSESRVAHFSTPTQ